MRLLKLVLVGVYGLAALSCMERQSNRPPDKNIEVAIAKYFEGDKDYLYKGNIDFNVPSLVKILASRRPDIDAASFDVYWVGKTSGADLIEIASSEKIIGRFEIENFEQGTVSDPLVEEYTGHAMFSMPLAEFDKLVQGSKLSFQLFIGGRALGDPFVAQKIDSPKNGLFKFIRQVEMVTDDL
jgi:hypothetical protein